MLTAILALVLLAGAFVWADNHLVNEYAITPGVAQQVGPLVTVSGARHADRRSIYLTDVFLSQLTAWQWLVAEVHPVDEQLISPQELTGPDVPTAELDDQGYLEMYDSQNNAKAAAMRALRLHVTGVPSGATVFAITNGAPAQHLLGIGDRIVAANGHAVSDACGLFSALEGAVPGRDVLLRVVRARISSSGVFSFSPPHVVEVPTTALGAAEAPIWWLPNVQPAEGCPGVPPSRVGLGLQPESGIDWTFPVTVAINTADIGGPSAGLAMTLSILDDLSASSITGGKRIAATGEILPNGAVGDVGGVAEKTVAVERAGIRVFFVPPAELGAASSTATPGLRLFAVSTLAQVLADLRTLGGTAPTPAADTALRVTRS